MEICKAITSTIPYYQILWAFGLLEHELENFARSEDFLRSALTGLSEAKEMGYSSVILLDLALLFAEQGRPAEVLKMAVEALPMLESLKLQDEALGAFQLLQEAVEAEEISLPTLQYVRDFIAQSQGNLTPRARARIESQ